MNPIRMIAAHRTYLGVPLGIATWLVFGLLFGLPGASSMTISMLVTMWASNTWEPKKAAGLGALVGFPAGIFVATQFFAQLGMPATDIERLVSLVGGIILVPIVGVLFMAIYAIEGLTFGSIAQLYNRKAIF